MKRMLVSTVVFLLCACAAPSAPVTTIARIESADSGPSRFRHCTVRLGWTENQLVFECGEPDAMVYRAGYGNGVRCAVYDSSAHALNSSNRSAPAVVVCMRNTQQPSRSGAGLSTRGDRPEPEVVIDGEELDNTAWTVVVAYGLSEYPDSP